MPTLDTDSTTGQLASTGTPYSYLSDLKSKLTPAQYNALIAPLMYTANEVYGGKVQDYQAQLLMPIDTAKAGIPKQIEFTKPSTKVVDYGDGSVEVSVPAAPVNSDKFDVYYGGNEDSPSYVDRYRSKEPVSINGVPVYANYDASGNLTGYEGDSRTTSWINGKQRIIGSWDANGRPNPQTSTSSGGGFFKGVLNDVMSDPVLGTAANIAASYFGGPLGTAALGLAQGKSPEDIAKNAAISYAGGQVASGVGGATGSTAAGQIAGNTASGLLSGQDLGTALTNSAINTGTNAAVGGLLNATNAPTADPYAVGGVYGPDNIDVGGGFNPSGINIPQGEGATLGSIGAAAETPNANPNLIGSIGTSVLGNYLKSALTNSLGNSSTPTGSTSAGLTGTGNMATTTPTDNNAALTSLLGGLLGGGGSLLQGETNTAARQAQADALRAAGQQAATSSQFRPVGTTTTFGTSNFQVDPATGQLISAGYNLSPQLQGYQNTLMAGGQQSLTDAANLQALGRGYIAQTPEAAAQKYMADQLALLQPGRDVESARLANQLQQTGRTGVSVAQGGSLGMANPEQQALANARSMQDLQLAAQAQQQGRAQTQFGQGLLTSAYDPFNAGLKTATGVESLGQQPFGMSTDLAAQFQKANAQGGAFNLNAQNAAANAMLPANQYNPYASLLSGAAGSPSVTGALGNLFGSTGVGSSLAKYLSGLGIGGATPYTTDSVGNVYKTLSDGTTQLYRTPDTLSPEDEALYSNLFSNTSGGGDSASMVMPSLNGNFGDFKLAVEPDVGTPEYERRYG
jgi:hypothetical protein